MRALGNLRSFAIFVVVSGAAAVSAAVFAARWHWSG
jgi:hypothetical protein